MTSQPAATTRGSGLQTAIDIIVSPNVAFARLRELPTWGWAYLIASVLGMVASLLAAPAYNHAVDASLPTLMASPQIAKLPPDQQQKMAGQILGFQHIVGNFLWIVTPVFLLIVALFQSVVMLIAKAVTSSSATFRQFWALALNVQVIGGLGGIVLGIIVLLRGPQSFSQTSEIQAVLPNLGMIVPGASRVLLAFLSALNVFAIWQTVIIALGLQRIAGFSRAAGWAVGIIFVLMLAASAAWGVASQPAPVAS